MFNFGFRIGVSWLPGSTPCAPRIDIALLPGDMADYSPISREELHGMASHTDKLAHWLRQCATAVRWTREALPSIPILGEHEPC